MKKLLVAVLSLTGILSVLHPQFSNNSLDLGVALVASVALLVAGYLTYLDQKETPDFDAIAKDRLEKLNKIHLESIKNLADQVKKLDENYGKVTLQRMQEKNVFKF